MMTVVRVVLEAPHSHPTMMAAKQIRMTDHPFLALHVYLLLRVYLFDVLSSQEIFPFLYRLLLVSTYPLQHHKMA